MTLTKRVLIMIGSAPLWYAAICAGHFLGLYVPKDLTTLNLENTLSAGATLLALIFGSAGWWLSMEATVNRKTTLGLKLSLIPTVLLGIAAGVLGVPLFWGFDPRDWPFGLWQAVAYLALIPVIWATAMSLARLKAPCISP